MALHAVTVLHLSDLHERGPRETEPARRFRVLGEVWRKNLAELRDEGPVDLVCFTGDLADWGHAAEFEPASTFLQDELLTPLGLPRERLFLVPGNHDIDRKREPETWQALHELLPRLDGLDVARWMAGGRAPLGAAEAQREAVLARQAAYRAWLKAWGRAALLPESSAHGRLGYRVSLRLDEERTQEASKLLLQIHENLTKALGPEDELTRRVAEELDELQQAQGAVEDETSLGDDVDS